MYVSDDPSPGKLDVIGAGKAALEGFGNAASMGYLPQLQAGVEKLTPSPTRGIDKDLEDRGFTIEPGDESYVAARDKNIARQERQREEHPYASAAGTVGGVVASGIAMAPMMAAKAAPLAANATRAERLAAAGGKIIQGVKTGAAMGAAANPGDTEGVLDPIQAGARYENAKTGAIVGGALSGAVEATPHVMNGIKAVGRKVAATVSGLSDDVVARYSARTDEINKMIKASGGNMSEAADQVRQEAQNAIRATRSKYSSQIGHALDSAPKDAVADVAPIKDQLLKIKERLNPNLQSESVGQIEAIVQKLDLESAATNGKVSIRQLHEITQFLQERAKSAYMQGGQIFQNAKEAAQASKAAAAVARKALNGLSPEIAKANNKLAALHMLEDRLNPNLIAPGRPDSALFAAGSGSNPRNAKMLESLGEVSGYPILDKAKDLAAARTFANPSFLPSDYTGKAVARQLIAGGLGAAVAGPVGAIAAGAASPAAVKGAINLANLGKKLPSITRAAQNNPALAQRIAQSISTPPKNEQAPAPTTEPKLGSKKEQGRGPAKGEAKWAHDGARKLGIADPSQINALMSDSKTKRLLIEASDLPPGSKALQKIKTQLEKGRAE